MKPRRLEALAVLMCLCGCGAETASPDVVPVVAERPEEARAFAIVREAFDRGMGMQGLLDSAPPVRWSFQVCPKRAADGTLKTAVVDEAGRCYSGLAYPGCDLRVAWRGSFSTSAYAHEIMHCLLDRAGRSDPEHVNEPAAWVLVEDTDRALAQSGL